jgi:prefoldin subunit 5
MCNRDGYFYHMDSYHRDQIEELKETIARLNELIPKVEELKVGRAEKISILTEIDYRIRKNRRLINHNKTKIFQFKLKMNKKKELHERKKKLDAEIRKMEASRDGSETKKIIGRTRKARSTNC